MSITLQILNGDIQHANSTGRPVTIANGDALKQGITCNLNTATRDNGFGAGIHDLVGIDIDDDDIAGMLLDRRVRASFTAMKNLQNMSPSNQRPSEERIAQIGVVQAQRDNVDHRIYRYAVNVVTEAGAVLRVLGALDPG